MTEDANKGIQNRENTIESRIQPPGKEKEIYNHNDMGDLAGVRVGVFFPGDIKRVHDAIKQNFEEIHPFGTVTDDSRSASTRRNKDIM